MHDVIVSGFLKEAGIATSLRSVGRRMVRGAQKIREGFTSAGQRAGELAGKGTGHAVAAPVSGGGKALQVAGAVVRKTEDKIEGARIGSSMGGVGLRRALRTGKGMTPKAVERMESKYKGPLDMANQRIMQQDADLVVSRAETARARQEIEKLKAPAAEAPKAKSLKDALVPIGAGAAVGGAVAIAARRSGEDSSTY